MSLWFKIKSILIYGISNWGFYKNALPTIITLLQSIFYYAKPLELNTEIDTLEKQLEKVDAKEKMNKLTIMSMDYLRAKLFEKYGNRQGRVIFTEDDLWKCPEDVVKEYLVVLSTTFASRSSLMG